MSNHLRFNLTIREGDTEQELEFATIKEAYEAVAMIATEAAMKDTVTFSGFGIIDRQVAKPAIQIKKEEG